MVFFSGSSFSVKRFFFPHKSYVEDSHFFCLGEDAVAVLLSVDDIITSVSTLASSNDSAVAGVAAETIGCLCSNGRSFKIRNL